MDHRELMKDIGLSLKVVYKRGEEYLKAIYNKA